MFSIGKKSQPKTSDQEKLEKVIEILFPPLELREEGDVKFHIDYSADSNLDAALTDLEDGHNDAIVQKTIRGVANRLVEVRRILEAYRLFDKRAQYLIVDDLGGESVEEIEPTDRTY